MEKRITAHNTKRIEYIDLFRAFGIFLMIMGHSGFGSIFSKWIHCFHMPMFLIISGYFFKETPFKTFIKRKVRTILIPYFALGSFHCIIYFLINGFDSTKIYAFLWENTSGMPIAGALWFLTAMFFSEILFWVIQHLKVSELFKKIIVCIIALIGMACATYLPFRLPYALDVGMVGIGFYLVGKLLKEKYNCLIEQNLCVALIGLCLFSILGFINGTINLRTGLYSIWPLFWLNAIGMTISLWNLSRILYEWIIENSVPSFPLYCLLSIGKDSILFLSLNQLAIYYNRKLLDGINVPNSSIFILLRCVVVLTLTIIELLVVHHFVMKTKLRVLFGK